MKLTTPAKTVLVFCAIALVAGVFVGSDRLGWWGADEARATGDDGRGEVLFAVMYDPFRFGDDVAHDLLVNDGWDVTVQVVDNAGDLALGAASTYDVLVVSASVLSSHITDLGGADVPIVSWERAAYDEMGLFTASGTLPDELTFAVDDRHPLVAVAELTDKVTFSTVGQGSAGGGTPIDDLVPLGTFSDGRIGWFEVPEGATLTDASAAPACRIGLPFNDKSETLTGLTSAGKQLLVQSVRYAANGCAVIADPPPTTAAPTTVPPTTAAPTTVPPTTAAPTTVPPTPSTVPTDEPDPAGAPSAPRSSFVVTDDGFAVPVERHGSTRELSQSAPLAGGIVTAMSSGTGWWAVDAWGRVAANDGAPDLGDLDGLALNSPIVGGTSTPSGEGFWLVASDGGVFSFGDADFHGSTGSMVLNAPTVGVVATPSGEGYWLVASDGGVFAFGDASFRGSLGAIRLNSPIVAAIASPDGDGYHLTAADGGVFAFGDGAFHGSQAESGERWVLAVPHLEGGGYTLVGAGGQTAVHGADVVVPDDVTHAGSSAVATIVVYG